VFLLCIDPVVEAAPLLSEDVVGDGDGYKDSSNTRVPIYGIANVRVADLKPVSRR